MVPIGGNPEGDLLLLVNVHSPYALRSTTHTAPASLTSRYAEDPTHCNLHETVAQLDKANRAWLTHAVIASILYYTEKRVTRAKITALRTAEWQV